MTDAKELELIKCAQGGDIKAKNQLCKMHVGFVKSTAAKYSIKGLDYDDIIQLCFDGLVKAIDDYDLDSNIHLISYAKYKMMGIVTRKAGELSKLKRSGKECNIDELFDLSVEGEFYSDDCFTMLEKCIKTANIPDKNKNVLLKVSKSIKYEYGSVCGLQAVGDEVGLSRERVRQIVNNVRDNPNFKLLHKQLKEMVEA